MAAKLDFTNFNFDEQQLRSVKELLYDEVIKSPEIAQLYTVYNGIVFDKEVGFVGKGGLVGVANQGCEPTPQAWNIGTRKIVWEPKSWEILIAECASDLEAVAAVHSLRTGVRHYDFTETDYMAIVLEVLGNSVKDFITRIVWFGDEDAANIVLAQDGTIASGEITAGVSTGYFTLLNGLFKQMETQVVTNPKQLVSITANTGASHAAQALDADDVQAILNGLVYNAPIELRSRKEKFILCTQSVYDAYEQSISGTALESAYRNMVDGVVRLTFHGIPLVAMPKWDEIIVAYYNSGSKTINPHRAVFTSKDFLALGVDDENGLGTLETWYDRDSRKVKVEAMGKIDAKLANPAMFTIAI